MKSNFDTIKKFILRTLKRKVMLMTRSNMKRITNSFRKYKQDMQNQHAEDKTRETLQEFFFKCYTKQNMP